MMPERSLTVRVYGPPASTAGRASSQSPFPSMVAKALTLSETASDASGVCSVIGRP